MKEIKNINDLTGFKRNACYECIHRRNVPGSAHSSCSKNNSIVRIDEHGLRSGWGFHPFDFDPIWINSCDSYYPKGGLQFSDRDEALYMLHNIIGYQGIKLKNVKRINSFKELSSVLEGGLEHNINEYSKEQLESLYKQVIMV